MSERLVESTNYVIIHCIKAVSCCIMGYYLINDITINMALYSPDDFLISAISEFEITKRLKYTHPNVSNESEKQKSWRLLPEWVEVEVLVR